jgi:hypothetical protein
VVGQASIHGEEGTPNRFQGEHVPFRTLLRDDNRLSGYEMTPSF